MSECRPALIAHLIYRLDVGGLENGLVNLVNGMPSDRFRHAIICLAGVNPEFRQRITRPDVTVCSVDKRPGKDLRAYWRIGRMLRGLRPDIVHTRNLGTVDLQYVAALAGIRRRVHGEHGWEASDPCGVNPRSLTIRRACRPLVQRYVAVSKDIAAWLVREVGARPACVRQVYNGVDAVRFRPGVAPASDVPWANAAERPLVVGTIGRLDPIKDQASLLRAGATLIARRSGARQLRLMIAGDGPLRPSLEALAGQLGIREHVWFSGRRDDIPALLGALDVFVMPSLNEGISNTILEAMAAGLPVVARRVGGNPELIEAGVSGMLCEPPAGANPPGGDAALVEALASYLDDGERRQRHGEAARRRTLERFSLEAMIAGYGSVYDELMCRAGGSGTTDRDG
jgi:sugar transferase (PEP-CTERM/EpsH1 system associated)